MYKNGGKKGSALIMVMLVIAGITTIVFSAQRIALVQFSQSVREEDNLTAYYAAQAGIEDGLVRYKFEKNTETSKDKKFRFDITNANYPSSIEIDSSVGIDEGIDSNGFDPNHQYYDLVINYKTQRINIDDQGEITGISGSVLNKDEALALTGFPVSSETNYLRYVFNFVDVPACNIGEAFVTMQIIREISSGGSVSRESKQIKIEKPVGFNQYDSSTSASNLDVSNSGTSTVSSIRIRAYHCNVQYAFATSTLPDGNGSDANNGLEFDSLNTEILSTGYYGSAKRTLIAQVDRQSGNLIGIFDFILYSGGNTGTIGQ